MSAFTDHLSAFTPIALPVLLDSAVKGAAILALTGLASLALRRASAAARHLLWFLGIVGVLLLPVLSACLPGWHVLPRWAMASMIPAAVQPTIGSVAVPVPAVAEPQPMIASPARNDIAEEATASPISTTPTIIARSLPRVVLPQSTDVAPRAKPMQINWQGGLLLTWAAGTLLLLGRIAIGILSLGWLQHLSAPVTDGDWPMLLRRLRDQLGVRQPVILLSSARRTMPMTWGIWRPRLLLPRDAENWPDEQRRAVLLHELAHARRGDCLTQLLTQIACAIYWFNPLLWLAWRRMQTEREQACDDMVLSTGAKASAYAEQLLHIAAEMPPVRFSAAAIAMARPSKLEARLLAILDMSRNRRALTWSAVAFVALLMAAFAVPLATLRAEDRGAVGTTAKSSTRPAAQAMDGANKPFAQLPLQKLIDDETPAAVTQPAATEPSVAPNSFSLRGPPEAATTHPAVTMLEFRIVPNGIGSSKAPAMTPFADKLVAALSEQGPAAANMKDEPIQWFELAGEVKFPDAVIGEYQGRKYLLLAARPPHIMVSGEGSDAWGLTNVSTEADGDGHLAVAITFDERGAELFAALTKANIENALAIIVDGKVVSAPVIQAALGKKCIITGQFSEQEAKRLVHALDAGLVWPAYSGVTSQRSSLVNNQDDLIYHMAPDATDSAHVNLEAKATTEPGAMHPAATQPARTMTYRVVAQMADQPDQIWQAMLKDGHARMASTDGRVLIHDAAQGKMLFLDPTAKTATVSTPVKIRPDDPMFTVANIEKMADPGTHPVESLGTKSMAGQPVEGIRFAVGHEIRIVWRDPASHRPLQIKTTIPPNAHLSKAMTMIFSDIVFDVPLDDALFSTEPPAGYELRQGTRVEFQNIPTTIPATQPAASQPALSPAEPAFQSIWLTFRADPPRLDLGEVSEPQLWQRLVAQVRQETAEKWPDAEVREQDKVLRVLFHVREQDVMRPASKKGGMIPRRELGPKPDGFLLEVWFTDQSGQAIRPQIMNREPWRTFLGEVLLAHRDTRLEINVDYGRAVDGPRLDQFVNPTRWLTAADPATRPAATQSAAKLVADPVAVVRGVLPPGLIVQQVIRDSYPTQMQPGKGLGIFIGLPPEQLTGTPHKQIERVGIWIMPPGYVGRSRDIGPNNVMAQEVPARQAASTSDGDIYIWGDPDLGRKVVEALIQN